MWSEDAAVSSPLASARPRRDDRFVPVRVSDLIDGLATEFQVRGGDPVLFRDVAGAVRDILEQETNCFERQIEQQYACCNPDNDTLDPPDIGVRRTREHYAELNRRLGYLLDKANFARLDDVQIDEVVRIAEMRGLRVRLNPERIEDVSLWIRGHGKVERRLYTWRHPFRGESRSVPVFRRLVVAARLRGDPAVILKMFKDIPEDDVEALLPHAEVRMSWLDHLTTVGGSVSALGSTAWKLLTVSLIALTQLAWLLSVGLIIVAYRLIMGYRRARLHRDSQRTRHLYFQNLTNNTGTIHMLINMIADEEVKEALLAYALSRLDDPPPASDAELEDRVEYYLHRRYGVHVRFDIADAVRTLQRLGLLHGGDGRAVLSPADALPRLREHWRERRTERHHCELAAKYEFRVANSE